jgi:hypothetical protein
VCTVQEAKQVVPALKLLEGSPLAEHLRRILALGGARGLVAVAGLLEAIGVPIKGGIRITSTAKYRALLHDTCGTASLLHALHP